MKIYCVIKNEMWDGDDTISVITCHDKETALATLKIEADYCRPDWRDEKIVDDDEDTFFAYRDGEYSRHHCSITIEETELI